MGTGYVRQDTDNSIETGEIIEAAELDNEFNAIVAAFNATTGHTHDGTSAEGGPITVLGPAQDLIVSATRVVPKTTNVLDIGSSTFRFKDAFFNGTVSAVGFAGPLTGVASSATVLTTSRNFSIAGGATAAAVAFNGSANVVLNVTALDATTLTGLIAEARLPTVMSPTTFRNGPPGLTVARTDASINAVVEYNTTAGSIFAGQGTAGVFQVGTTSNLNDSANSSFSVVAASGNISWDGVATGNGSNITNLDATALTGNISQARLVGSYTNFVDVTGSGFARFPTFRAVSPGGSAGTPSYSFSDQTNTGMYYSGNGLSFTVDGERQVRILDGEIFADNGAIFRGDGSLLTNIPTTALTGTIPATDLSGIVPSARISGSYTGITGTGALNAGSITSGFGSINIGASVFTGNGSGLTNLDASAATTGTLSTARLPTTTQARDWVLARTAEIAAHNAIGSYAMLSQISGTAANPGQTKTATALNYAHAGGVGPGTISPAAGSVWMCMSDLGGVGSGDASVGLWLRVS